MKKFDIVKIGKRIKELRESIGLSQKDLGGKLGVAQNTITGYETGKSNPSLETIFKLAIIFDTTADYLLGLTDF